MNMSSKTYDTLAQHPSYSWICCRCGLPNFASSFFSNTSISTSNNFDPLSPISDTSPRPQPIASSTPTKIKPKQSPRQQTLRTVLVNCRGIKGKKAEYQAMIDTLKPDIVAGTESHLEDSINTNEIFPPDYTTYRNDRNRHGGGVFISVKNKWVSRQINPSIDVTCEVIWVSVDRYGSSPITIGSFYRPPGSPPEALTDLTKSATSIKRGDNSCILIAGDFNLPGIDWNEQKIVPGSRDGAQCQTLLNFCDDMALDQLVKEPTRHQNTLDLIFTSHPGLVQNTTVGPGLADHDIVITDMHIKAKWIKKPKRNILLYHKADTVGLTANMEKYRHSFSISNNTNDTWLSIKRQLAEVTKLFVPSKTTSGRHSAPWYNNNLKRDRKKNPKSL